MTTKNNPYLLTPAELKYIFGKIHVFNKIERELNALMCCGFAKQFVEDEVWTGVSDFNDAFDDFLDRCLHQGMDTDHVARFSHLLLLILTVIHLRPTKTKTRLMESFAEFYEKRRRGIIKVHPFPRHNVTYLVGLNDDGRSLDMLINDMASLQLENAV